ncbi:MAG: polyprenyl synthetase family protein [Desulfurococcales archaeon]|nr:polyprenyl synthetase family protein [Desulfurococcales archaeon]
MANYLKGAERVEEIEAILYREWAEKKALIEEEINRVVNTQMNEAELIDVAKYISTGGKRFRGFLTLLTAEALGGKLDDALDAAVAIELVQAASLALDDIIDKDQLRRGRAAAWIVHGLPKTILSSLLFIPVSQRIVEKLGFRAIFHVIRAWEATVRGEILDSLLPELVPASRYIELCRLKTGSLFKLSTILGAISARVSSAVEKAMGEYGELLGILYQVADDVADYYNYKLGLRNLEPGIRHFEKWALTRGDDPVEVGLSYLQDRLAEAERVLDTVEFKNDKSVLLYFIPRFMVEKMLAEAGLKL